MYFLSQSNFQTNIYIRKQCRWIVLCGIRSNKDLTRILSEHEFGNISSEEMAKIYEYCKEPDDDPNEINFAKICTFHCAKDKKISKNWLEYINPNDFKTNIKAKSKSKDESDNDNESESDNEQ